MRVGFAASIKALATLAGRYGNCLGDRRGFARGAPGCGLRRNEIVDGRKAWRQLPSRAAAAEGGPWWREGEIHVMAGSSSARRDLGGRAGGAGLRARERAPGATVAFRR